MISQREMNELYNVIASDLKIKQYEGENFTSYKFRLIYSALGKWIMTLFKDRNFEDEDDNQVSKSHVTLSAKNVLNSYKKIDLDLNLYFTCEKIIDDIEDIYLITGYINNGNYNFKNSFKYLDLKIANKILTIDIDSNIRKMRGLGLWSKQLENINYIELKDYLLIKDNAHDYTNKLINKLKFEEFNYNYGKIEIYNIEKNRWEIFNEKKLEKYEYYIAKIEDGLDYKIIKKIDNILYSSSLPIIYTKQGNDFIFQHEVWRVILGICSINGIPAHCTLSKIYDKALLIKFGGFILPTLENSLFKCMVWPLNNCININEFITDYSMKEAIIELLNTLSITIIEEE